MTEQPQSPTEVDAGLRRFREYVTAMIALILIIGTAVVLAIALTASGDAERFSRIKDIVNTIVPLLTFVLGYYFNKASTEARAENAEMTAQSAVSSAQKATQDRDLAKQAEEKAQQERDRLAGDVSQAKEIMKAYDEQLVAADQVLEKVETTPASMPKGKLGIGEEGEPAQDTQKVIKDWRQSMQNVRARAHALLEQ